MEVPIMGYRCVCDLCGREAQRWYSVAFVPCAAKDWMNVGDMPPFRLTVCADCGQKLRKPSPASKEDPEP